VSIIVIHVTYLGAGKNRGLFFIFSVLPYFFFVWLPWLRGVICPYVIVIDTRYKMNHTLDKGKHVIR
jgi:hypothetical protein